MSELNIDKMSFLEATEALRRALKNRYPDCGFLYFAYQPVVGKKKDNIGMCGGFGDQATIETCGTDIVLRDKNAENFVHDVFMNYILSMGRREMSTPILKRLHDCVLDYAESRGISTKGIERFLVEEPKKVENTKDLDDKSVEGIASRIKMLQDEIKSLQREIDPDKMVAVLKAVAKRMRRAGDIKGANEKEQQAERILARRKRQAELKVERLEFLERAREARAANKLKKIQAEKDRKKAQQFNPHKAAKAKMQKIRERQAERKASKKKASESKEWVNTPIGQVIAKRV